MDEPGAQELPREARRALEAIVMVAGDPVEPQMLAQLLEVSVERVEAACTALSEQYAAEDRGFVLQRVAGGYRFQSHPDAAPYVERYVLEGQSARLSNAALETLAIVAYKQPLSRAQVASIRGVNVDGVMRTLAHRGLVAEVARDPGPGQAVLYGTTPLFLERLGLDALDDLPPIASFVPGADVVEALEHSLRVDPDDPPTLPEVDDEQDGGAPDEAEGDDAGADEAEVAGEGSSPPEPATGPVAEEPVAEGAALEGLDLEEAALEGASADPGEGDETLDLAALGDAQAWESDDPDVGDVRGP